jgi:acetyltransferase EpsM
MEDIALIGAGGHCKVIIDLINSLGSYNIVGIYDDNKKGQFCNYNILGKSNNLNPDIKNYIISIGNDKIRKKIYENNKKLNWVTLIHPSAILAKNVIIDIGSVIFAGSIIQTDVKIGKHCIINTGCSIDHECVINDFSSICPKATLCGQVKIGNLCFIGANATIIQCLTIGNNCIIGAGSVIIKNAENNSKIVGNPGKVIK